MTDLLHWLSGQPLLVAGVGTVAAPQQSTHQVEMAISSLLISQIHYDNILSVLSIVVLLAPIFIVVIAKMTGTSR